MMLDLRAHAKAHAPSLPALPHLQASALATWRGRMINEHSSAVVFEALAKQLADAGFENAIVEECRSFADEERRHGVLCGAVVESLGGKATFESPSQRPSPEHPAASRREAALRNLLSVCCLSETVAVALIGAERLQMPDGELRSLLTRIYADEVGHARFGWRLLPELVASLSPQELCEVNAYLAVAFAALESHELRHLNPAAAPPPEGCQLGLCNGQDARRLFYATVTDVIVTGLERHGLAAAKAWAERATHRE